jgi:septal ring factor EnvC (AmiA/AmiB activator)
MSGNRTQEEINQEYQKLTQQLGQLALQKLDADDALARMNDQIANLRVQARKLAQEFNQAAPKEVKNDVDVVSPTPG